ncbi:MAG: biotin--[acetyl-CoA-carboxylase] ligase [Terracidiphilus sp.]|jgi:BirA family biotin operon repressor/biotin-[acetyl-CoA-carboxylase] ligase
MFDLPALEASLADARCAGKLHFAPVTNSTNTDALEAARAGAPHWSVYFADEQLAGRGRSNHTWQSPAGEGLYVSILFCPCTFPNHLPMLPLIAGLAAASAIKEVSGLTIDLRWPNDLLIGPRKTGGILVEARTEADKIAYAVIGIGINVHQRSFDPTLATPATSLDLDSGHIISRQDLLISLLNSLELETRDLPHAFHTIPSRIEAASTWVRGKRVHVHGPQPCTGVTAGLDPNGFLLVQTENGLVTVRTGGLRAVEPTAEPEPADIS